MALQVTLLFGIVSMTLIESMRRQFAYAYGMETQHTLAFLLLMVALFFSVYDAAQRPPVPAG